MAPLSLPLRNPTPEGNSEAPASPRFPQASVSFCRFLQAWQTPVNNKAANTARLKAKLTQT